MYVLYQALAEHIGRISSYSESVSPIAKCSLCKYSIQPEKRSIDGNSYFFMNICLGNPMNIKLPIDCNIAKADDLLLGLAYYSLKFPLDNSQSQKIQFGSQYLVPILSQSDVTLEWGVLS